MSTYSDLSRLWPLALERFGGSPNDVLHQALQAETEAVERVAGSTVVTETFVDGYGRQMIHVTRPIALIETISERRTPTSPVVMLGAGDFRLVDRWRIVRLPGDAPSNAWSWGWQTDVVYQAEVDQALRDRVVLDLVALDLAFSPGGRVTLLDFSAEPGANPEARRTELLAQLREGPMAMVI